MLLFYLDGECLQKKLKKQQTETLKLSQDEALKERVEILFANLLHLLLLNINNGLKNIEDNQLKNCQNSYSECVIHVTLSSEVDHHNKSNKTLERKIRMGQNLNQTDEMLSKKVNNPK